MLAMASPVAVQHLVEYASCKYAAIAGARMIRRKDDKYVEPYLVATFCDL